MMARIGGASIPINPPLPTTTNCKPWNAKKAASVTTNEGIPTFATKSPIRKPISIPIEIAITAAIGQATPYSDIVIAKNAADNPAVTPADKSISPKSKTKVNPIASVVTVAVWVNKLAKLIGFKKIGFATAKIVARITKPSKAGKDPVSPHFTRAM